MRRCLERMCLHDHFDAMVTAEDDMESIAQQLLSASMKLSRPPNMCVYFAVTPEGITAAHNCTMKAVAVQVRGGVGLRVQGLGFAALGDDQS